MRLWLKVSEDIEPPFMHTMATSSNKMLNSRARSVNLDRISLLTCSHCVFNAEAVNCACNPLSQLKMREADTTTPFNISLQMEGNTRSS